MGAREKEKESMELSGITHALDDLWNYKQEVDSPSSQVLRANLRAKS